MKTAFVIYLWSLLIYALLRIPALVVLKAEENVWTSGVFLLFPVIAVVSGWISLFRARNEIRKYCQEGQKIFTKEIDMP